MSRRPPLAAAALAAAVTAPLALAQGPLSEPVVVANLDGDAANERVVVREISCGSAEGSTPPPCDRETTVFREIQVDLVDECGGTERRTALLPRTEEAVDQLAAREIDGDRSRREVVVTAYSGASGRVGSGAVVRLVDGADGCAKVRRLFTFGPAKARTPRPKGASDHAIGTLRVLSLRKDFRGKELRFTEPWYRRGDASCCPTWSSAIDLRYDRRTDRYVRYRSRIVRLDQG